MDTVLEEIKLPETIYYLLAKYILVILSKNRHLIAFTSLNPGRALQFRQHKVKL